MTRLTIILASGGEPIECMTAVRDELRALWRDSGFEPEFGAQVSFARRHPMTWMLGDLATGAIARRARREAARPEFTAFGDAVLIDYEHRRGDTALRAAVTRRMVDATRESLPGRPVFVYGVPSLDGDGVITDPAVADALCRHTRAASPGLYLRDRDANPKPSTVMTSFCRLRDIDCCPVLGGQLDGHGDPISVDQAWALAREWGWRRHWLLWVNCSTPISSISGGHARLAAAANALEVMR